jgi:hypothetical protein
VYKVDPISLVSAFFVLFCFVLFCLFILFVFFKAGACSRVRDEVTGKAKDKTSDISCTKIDNNTEAEAGQAARRLKFFHENKGGSNGKR